MTHNHAMSASSGYPTTGFTTNAQGNPRHVLHKIEPDTHEYHDFHKVPALCGTPVKMFYTGTTWDYLMSNRNPHYEAVCPTCENPTTADEDLL